MATGRYLRSSRTVRPTRTGTPGSTREGWPTLTPPRKVPFVDPRSSTSEPSVTTRVRGPRCWSWPRPRRPATGAVGCGPAAGAGAPAGRGARRTTRVPKRSRRSTARIDSTRSHSRARKPRRSRVRVSSLIARRSPLSEAEHEPAAADGDRAAVPQVTARHALAVHERAVRRAEVDDPVAAVGDVDLGVPAGHTGVVERYVDVRGAAQHGHRPGERDAPAVEFQGGGGAVDRGGLAA